MRIGRMGMGMVGICGNENGDGKQMKLKSLWDLWVSFKFSK